MSTKLRAIQNSDTTNPGMLFIPLNATSIVVTSFYLNTQKSYVKNPSFFYYNSFSLSNY